MEQQPGMPGAPGMDPAMAGGMPPPPVANGQAPAAGGLPAEVDQLPTPPPKAGPDVNEGGEIQDPDEEDEEDRELNESGDLA